MTVHAQQDVGEIRLGVDSVRAADGSSSAANIGDAVVSSILVDEKNALRPAQYCLWRIAAPIGAEAVGDDVVRDKGSNEPAFFGVLNSSLCLTAVALMLVDGGGDRRGEVGVALRDLEIDGS